jgi:hypothetical protein
MPVVKLPKECTLHRVEELLHEFVLKGKVDIEVPLKLQAASMMGEPSLLQGLITWSRHNSEGAVVLPTIARESQNDVVDKLAKRAFGFTALLAGADVVSGQGGMSYRRVAYDACERRVLEIGRSVEDVVYGHRTFLPCVDHSTRWQLPVFYHQDGRVRSRSEFKSIAYRLLHRRAPAFTNSLADELVSALGSILFELFLNTHDWGRTDVDNRPYRKSFRGVLLTRHTIDVAGMSRATSGCSQLKDFGKAMIVKSPDKYARFIELSVFDSGPGLAARWNGGHISDEIAIEEEKLLCESCLGKHKTTSYSTSRGLGLFEVMQTLSELSGFLRIRTGRLSLLRDFIKNPVNTNEATDPRLFIMENDEGLPIKLARVEGTLITAIFPVAATY